MKTLVKFLIGLLLAATTVSCNRVKIMANTDHIDGCYSIDAAKDAVSRYGDNSVLDELYILSVDSIADKDYTYYLYMNVNPLPDGKSWNEIEDLVYKDYCMYTPSVREAYKSYRKFIGDNYNPIYPIYMHKVYKVTYSINHDGNRDTCICGSISKDLVKITGNDKMVGLLNMGSTEMAFIHNLIPLYSEASDTPIKKWTIDYIKTHYDSIVKVAR